MKRFIAAPDSLTVITNQQTMLAGSTVVYTETDVQHLLSAMKELKKVALDFRNHLSNNRYFDNDEGDHAFKIDQRKIAHIDNILK